MKKMICALLALLMIAALVGCGNNNAAKSQSSSGNSVSSVMQQQMNQGNTEQKNDTQQPVQPDNSSDKKIDSVSSDVDVDLTKLSSTMVYSEVYAMMTAPEEYIGKTVRMKGQFALYQATDSNGQSLPDQIYFACVIADATACCQQGLEFILAGDAKYPDDYPELGTDITVVGEFQTYMEGEYQYCHLIDARFE